MRLMVHRIYTGTLAALELRLFDEIARVQRDNPLVPVCILAGSNVLSSYLKYRLAEQRGAVANIRFYNFLDLATRLGRARAAVSRKPRLPFLGASLILDAILEQQALTPFAAVSKYPGFRNSVLDTFRDLDRKSTRLNSSHLGISYAVFCLKKKKKKKHNLQLKSRESIE